MLLTGRTRLRNLKRHLGSVEPGAAMVIGLTDLAAPRAKETM